MLRRCLRALERRAADGDHESLVQLVALQGDLQDSITAAGASLHAYGVTYTDLAELLGVTRQAARQRFLKGTPTHDHQPGHHPPDTVTPPPPDR